MDSFKKRVFNDRIEVIIQDAIKASKRIDSLSNEELNDAEVFLKEVLEVKRIKTNLVNIHKEILGEVDSEELKKELRAKINYMEEMGL